MARDHELNELIRASSFVEGLFDQIPDVVFFVKDRRGHYEMVNQTLVERCGRWSKAELVGRTSSEVFPAPLGDRFLEQDQAVCTSGTPIVQNLELHLYPTRLEGWCLTDKTPLYGSDDSVIGVAGISRDLQAPGGTGEGFAEVAAAVEHVRSHFGCTVRVEELARIAGLSIYQLNRRLRLIFGITAGQLITKTRIDAASELLRRGSTPIAEIANACGYFDQSAFSRVFRRTVGLTPRAYRARHQSS
jgi:AraC-like DNA-binding protein